MTTIDYNKLLELKNLINSGKASKESKIEYMDLLYKYGHITKSQHERFLLDQSSDDIINAGLTIGGVLLAVWLLSKLTDK